MTAVLPEHGIISPRRRRIYRGRGRRRKAAVFHLHQVEIRNETMTGRRVAIHTLGCRLNHAESTLLADRLREAGYSVVAWGEPADVGVVHTCTVTREADAKSRQMIRRFIRRNPGAVVAVLGCYAQRAADTLAQIEGVRLILGNAEKMNLVERLRELEQSGRNQPMIVRPVPRRETFQLPWVDSGFPVHRRVDLKIQDGCDDMCAFCVIPFARGRSRSRDARDAVAEAVSLTRRGARELVFTGVNIGDYQDGDIDLVALTDRVAEAAAGARLRISSIEPTAVSRALLERMADPAHPLVPFLHVPLQSGSDRILAAMKRDHTAAFFLELLRAAAERLPGAGFGTDVMAGFPGETDADFEETLALLEASPVDYAHVFPYSERPGTATSRMPGDRVPPEVVGKRVDALLTFSRNRRRRFVERSVGREYCVLFETLEDGYWVGYTEHYLRVGVPDRGLNLRNRFGWVRVEKPALNWAWGNLLEVLDSWRKPVPVRPESRDAIRSTL